METPLAPDARSAVDSLTLQRTRLQDWLARLDEVGETVPSHVAARVRRDYEDRLGTVTQELAAHRDSLVAELADRRAELEVADARRTSAADDLEEARLRHLIGEMEDDAWEARRPELESALSAAEAEASGVRSEVERLDALLREVPGGEPVGAAPEAEPVAAEPDADAQPASVDFLPPRDTSDDTVPEFPTFAASGGDDDLDVDLSWLDEVGEVSTSASPGAADSAGGLPESGGGSEDDLAFLEELDRAIASSPAVTKAPAASADGDRTLDPDRAGMLLCKECGAINEPQLWYCEICGSEL